MLRAQKRCARPAVTAVEVWRGRLPRSWLAKVPVAMDTFWRHCACTAMALRLWTHNGHEL